MKKFTLCIAFFFSLISCFSQAGGIDLSFGTSGKTYANVFDVNAGNEVFNAVVIQADGKIVAAGTTLVPSAIFRFNPDGSLDNTFDGDGILYCYGIKIFALTIQPDGKILIAGSAGDDFALTRYLANGTLDNSFDGDGRVITSVGPFADRVTALAIQSNGKIIAAGVCSNGDDDDFAVARYNTDGSLDNNFDTDGMVVTPIGSGIGTAYDQANAVAIQSNGKIVVAGYSYTDFALVRYTSTGGLDNSFDGDGILITDFGSSDDQATSVAIQSDGKIVAAGFTWDAITGFDFAVARYTSTGGTDNSFDGDGKAITDLNSIDKAMAMCIQADGKILLAGNNEDFAMVRYTTSGSLDNSFDGDGKVTTDISTSFDQVQAVALYSDGKIAVVGRSDNGGRFDFSLAVFNTNGSPDNNFSGDGKLMIPTACSEDHATCMAVQNDGKVLVGGYSSSNVNGSNRDFALYRFNPNGTPDNSFDGDGRVSTNIGNSHEVINAIIVQPDGKIIVAGASRRVNDVYYDFALVRYNTDGSPDNSFDGDGQLTTMISSFDNIASTIALQPDGKIVVAGYTYNVDQYDMALVRYNTDGSPDNSFDGDGQLIMSIGAFDDRAFSVAVQADGKIVVAGVSENGSNADFAMARFNSNGIPDSTFDGDGKLTTDISASNDVAYSVAIQHDGKILIGGYSQQGPLFSFAAARYNSDGTPDTGFDGDGIVTTQAGVGALGSSLAIQADGKILLAGDSDNGSNMDFMVIRYNTNGSLDNSFSGDGRAEFNLENGSSERLTAMKLYSDRIYLAGEMQTAGGYDFVLAAMFTGPMATPLPLRLLDFTGKLINQDALLDWKTDNETGTKEFIIERSVNGSDYRPVGSVLSANRQGTQFYNFTDNNIVALNVPVVYYRLKQSDIDGKFVYSRIVALPVEKNKNLVMFYPNPVITEAILTITTGRPTQVLCRIVDNSGRTIKSTQWNLPASGTSLPIDLGSLRSGIYYLELAGEGISYKKQFVKK